MLRSLMLLVACQSASTTRMSHQSNVSETMGRDDQNSADLFTSKEKNDDSQKWIIEVPVVFAVDYSEATTCSSVSGVCAACGKVTLAQTFRTETAEHCKNAWLANSCLVWTWVDGSVPALSQYANLCNTWSEEQAKVAGRTNPESWRPWAGITSGKCQAGPYTYFSCGSAAWTARCHGASADAVYSNCARVLSGSEEQKAQQCFGRCIAEASDFTYFAVHDGTACFCKRSLPEGPFDNKPV